ncbi:MAG: nitroreductase family deazaflavin-dependent oxidoreductase [Geodermatophilaceae bacterium]|jgi:deazaflavin-dependent oxidoreductase (nitroreductase family)|nr:nitroreductase family deazaflavin-dependent oxidoreductase [Geodermatophilaceae bacterium]
MLYGDAHVKRYRETDGEEGHDWNGTQALILTTTGRKSGQSRDNALIYGLTGDNPIVVASKGGDPAHPDWYVNLVEQPEVEVQIRGDRFPARARTATGEERTELWAEMLKHWAPYDEYQTKTDRQIPVVVLDRIAA